MNHPTHPLAGLTDPSLAPVFWPAERLGVASPWWPHVPFGHWIASAIRPRVLVELGTGTGVSYSAFCQAVVREALDTRCYAIDTWADGPGEGIDGQAMFADLKHFHDKHFSAFSTLTRSTSHEALSHFADRTADLLHINVLHSYKVVRHDFENWQPKLSARAVVLLHNTNMHAGDVGVWQLWNELCQRFPNFEFLHGNGLGILAVGADVPPAIVALCGLAGSSSVAAVRGCFAAVGERWMCDVREKTVARGLCQRISTATAEIERVQAEAGVWERRAEEDTRARVQIARRIDAARRDVYDANLLSEQAQAAAALALDLAEQARATAAQEVKRAEQAEAAVALQVERAEQAETAMALQVKRAEQVEAAMALQVERAEQAETAMALQVKRAEQVEAAMALQVERADQAQSKVEQVVRERNALRSSNFWRATWPLRATADRALRGWRHVVRLR